VETLLIVEDDVPMRLVALALGAHVDDQLKEGLMRLFAAGADEAVRQLRRAGVELGLAQEVMPVLATGAPLEDQLDGVHYLFVEDAPVTATALARGRDLKLIQKFGEDCRNIDLKAAADRRILVATIRRWVNSSVAEHTLLLMLAITRRLLAAHQAALSARPGAWRGASSYNWARLEGLASLRGATLGIIGLGEIGREVAQRARAFQMRVLYAQRQQLEPEVEEALQLVFRPLSKLLAESGIVSLHVPLTQDTYHLLGAQELWQMRKGAILINTSRGRVIDESALLAALRDRHLGGAGLDVRHDEPPADAAGWTEFDTVVLTPHIAAGTGTEVLQDARTVLENIARVRRGDLTELSLASRRGT